jgi:hypothetical protein
MAAQRVMAGTTHVPHATHATPTAQAAYAPTPTPADLARLRAVYTEALVWTLALARRIRDLEGQVFTPTTPDDERD